MIFLAGGIYSGSGQLFLHTLRKGVVVVTAITHNPPLVRPETLEELSTLHEKVSGKVAELRKRNPEHYLVVLWGDGSAFAEVHREFRVRDPKTKRAIPTLTQQQVTDIYITDDEMSSLSEAEAGLRVLQRFCDQVCAALK